MFFRACYLLLVLNVGIGASLKWTEASLGQDAYITACVGDPVNLTWDFQPPDNDAVQSIYWSFGSNNTIASWLMGSFQTKPPFSGRVKFLAAASLMLDRVSPRDSGMYSVEVRLSEEKNTEHRSAFLAVAVPPVLKNKKLEVQYVHSKNGCDFKSQVTLTCGHFLSTGFPPVSVLWKMSLSETVTVDLNDGVKSQSITCVEDMLMTKMGGDGELHQSKGGLAVLGNLSVTEATVTTLKTATEETPLQQQVKDSNTEPHVDTKHFMTSRIQQPAKQASTVEAIVTAALQKMVDLTEFRIDFYNTQQQLQAKVLLLEKAAQSIEKLQNVAIHLEESAKASQINISRLETALEQHNLQLSSLQAELEKAQNTSKVQQGVINSLSQLVREQDQNISGVVRDLAKLTGFHLNCTRQQTQLAGSVQGLAEKLESLSGTGDEREKRNQMHFRSLREEICSNMNQTISEVKQQVTTRMFQVDAKTENLTVSLREAKSMSTNQDIIGEISNMLTAQNLSALAGRFTQMEHLQAQSERHLNSLVKDFESVKSRHCE